MFRIAKQFHFSASHQLTHLPSDHPCARLHGHNYVVEVELSGLAPSAATGFIVDYRALDGLKREIDEVYDHQHLNDVLGGDPVATTAENLARQFFEVAVRVLPDGGYHVSAVRVSETPKTWAEYRPRGGMMGGGL